MRIVKVDPIVIDLPLEKPVQTSFDEMKRRTNVLVRIEADTGDFGIGEIWNNFPSWGVYEKIATLKYGISPLLIGEDPREISKINHKLFSKLTVLGLQWGALGPIYHSISGVDIALWDLVGKYYKLPIHKLLGGKIHNEIEVYASGLGPALLDDLVIKHKEMGIKNFKLKVGKDADLDYKNLKRLREIVDQDDKIMIDANQAWTRREAVECLKRYKPFGLTWVEEPIQCEDLDGLRYIREQTQIPVAAGENIYGRVQYRNALEKKSVDIIQPDLSKNGGISEAKVIAEMASSWQIPFAPHFLGGAVCFVSSIHFIASINGGTLLELDANPNPFRERLFETPLSIRDGKVKAPDGPGLGLELDNEFIEYFRLDLNDL